MLSARACLYLTITACACAPATVVTTPMPVPQPGSTVRYATIRDSSQLQRARVIAIDADRLVAVRDKPVAPGRWKVDSVPRDSIAALQVRIGRPSNATWGLLIGGLAGALSAVSCASEDESSFFSYGDETCIAMGAATAGLGFAIGALTHHDQWALAAMPQRQLPPPPSPITVAPVTEDLVLPVRAR